MNSTMQAKPEVSNAIRITVPKPEELSDYYQSYLKYLNAEDDLMELIRRQRDETLQFLASISEDRAGFIYAPGKWQLKEVVGHVCDTERILSYRALRIARKDKAPLQGFDENHYTPASNYNQRTLKNISEELRTVRDATLSLISNFNPEMLDFKGTANDQEISVRGVIYMIYVHQKHHMTIIRDRYLS